MKKEHRFRRGAASFYIVAISTLILVIIATSFVTAVIGEITRSSNDDLSQSAYDSAMAGVEDAKVAFTNYKRCLENGATPSTSEPSTSGPVTCSDILYWMKNPDCQMVGHILGRIPKGSKSEVKISETNSDTSKRGSNNMDQAYTCVTIDTTLNDYRSDLTSSEAKKVIKVNLGSGMADKISKVKISWFSTRDVSRFDFANISYLTGGNNGQVVFRPIGANAVSTPPTLSVELIQTHTEFQMKEFEIAANGYTDRGTVYLVPFGNNEGLTMANNIPIKDVRNVVKESTDTYYYRENGIIEADAFVRSNIHGNQKYGTEKPYLVYCDVNTTAEYACSVTLELPKPKILGGTVGVRSDETFMFVVGVPYGMPDTDFSMQFICEDGYQCGTGGTTSIGSGQEVNLAELKDVQVKIDSTGRANDLFRRVETRLETTDSSFAYPFFGIQALGDGKGNDAAVWKVLKQVTTKAL